MLSIIIATLDPKAHWEAVTPTLFIVTASSLRSSAKENPRLCFHSLTIFVTAPSLKPLSAAISFRDFPSSHCCITRDLILLGNLAGIFYYKVLDIRRY